MTRVRKSTWGFVNGLILTLVSLGTGIVATPWVLRWLGRERFGAYRVLLDWFGYIGLFELGLGGALVAYLAVAIGRNDEATTRRLISSGLRAYSLVSLAMLVAGIAWVMALPRVISAETIGVAELRIAALILLVSALLTPLSVFRLLAEARQRSYLVNLSFSVQTLLMTGMLLVTAWAGWGLAGQSLSNVIAVSLIMLFLAWDGRRAYKGVFSERSNRETSRALWSLNWPTFIFNLSGRVGLLTDNIIIAWVIGPTAVVAFFLTQRLASIALGQMQGIGSATWAGLVELHVQGQTETFRARLLELTGLVSGLSLCLLGPIAAYNHYFIENWVGALNYAGESINVIACLNCWLLGIFSLWGWPVSGTGNIRRWTPYAVVFMLVNLLVSIVGTLTLGAVGPLLGTLVAFLTVYSWALPRVLECIFGLSQWQLWRSALAPLLWGVPYITIVCVIGRNHTPGGWFGLIVEMALTGLGGLILWWMFSLTRATRAIWIARLQDALRR